MKLFGEKKAMINLLEHWVEWLSLVILIAGLILGLWSRSAVVTYLVILLCGITFGRNMFVRTFKHKLIFYIIMIAFLVGFILGSFYGKISVIFVMFIIGLIVGYLLNKEGYI